MRICALHDNKQMRIRAVSMILMLLMVSAVALSAAGCGKSGISHDQYNQVQKGMTLDQVEGILGQPDRTHHTGSPQNPSIIWYYNKSEADGLVRLAFTPDAKLDSISPYDVSVNPDE